MELEEPLFWDTLKQKDKLLSIGSSSNSTSSMMKRKTMKTSTYVALDSVPE